MASIKQSLAELRIDYQLGKLLEAHCPKDPYVLFDLWFKEAAKTETEPNAMALATCTKQGRPSNRIVLLKGYSSNGFVFYTNYESRKGRELLENPFAACTFWWGQRSVRIEGKVVKVPPSESDAYFASRPKNSQIGAWISKQSSVLQTREELDAKEAELQQYYSDKEVKRPEHWGGYEIQPETIEFWQGRSSRLHDRILYSLADNEWYFKRLSP